MFKLSRGELELVLSWLNRNTVDIRYYDITKNTLIIAYRNGVTSIRSITQHESIQNFEVLAGIKAELAQMKGL